MLINHIPEPIKKSQNNNKLKVVRIFESKIYNNLSTDYKPRKIRDAFSTFFCLYQQNQSSESKVKFSEVIIYCERVLEAVKLVYANNTDSITSLKVGTRDFSQINNSVLSKGKSAIPLLFNGPEVLSSASDKTKVFVKNVFTTQVSVYLLSLLELI